MPVPVTSVRLIVRRLLLAAALAVGCARPLVGSVQTEPERPILTQIREIRSLSAARADEALPVIVRGIVTRVTAYELFLQDGPDAIFVWQEVRNPDVQVGDYIEVTGSTNSGQLFPIVRGAEIRRLGTRPLPEPQVLPYAELATGRGDCQWVEISGVVETVEPKPDGLLTLRVLYGGALLRVELTALEPARAARLLGAHVRVRGVVNGFKSPQRRLVEPVLGVEVSPATFWIEQPGPLDIFALPLVSAAALGGPEGSTSAREMVHVAGTVTRQLSPKLVFLRDRDHSLEVRLAEPATVQVGDQIEAVGFAEMGIIQPVLNNARLRRLGPGQPPAPHRIGEVAGLLDLRNEADLIEIEGELRDLSRRNDGYVMILTQGGQSFNVEVGAATVASPAELPPVGSRLAVVGICQIERLTPPDLNLVVAPASVRIYLRSMEEVTVLSRPSWWTPARLLALVTVLSAFALGALGWIVTLNRRVQAQTRIILGNARKQATLEERNRIAREFHDTLEQQLAGATILLDAIDTAILEQPQRARDNLQIARAMLRHSLDDAQQAVANLRNNDLFEREFVPLIEDAVQARLAGTGIPADFHTEGTWPELDSMVKQHLLRMVQEAVTNAVKHAAPKRITVVLRATKDGIELEVTDDGCGFILQDRLHPRAGEFGLIGLQERAEKIGARLTIRSAPRQGTTVMVALRPVSAFTA